MKALSLCLIALIALVLASGCEPCENCGVLNGDCYSWTGGCNEGLGCQAGTCVNCGGEGQPCCYEPQGPDTCSSGFACAFDGDGSQVCQGSCGDAGEPCCNGECPGGSCNPETNICELGATSCTGSGEYQFLAVNEWGCADFVTSVFANTKAEAQACADALVAATFPPNWTAGDVTAQATCQDVCQTGGVAEVHTTMHLCAYSAAELASCETSLCTNCAYADGACP